MRLSFFIFNLHVFSHEKGKTQLVFAAIMTVYSFVLVLYLKAFCSTKKKKSQVLNFFNMRMNLPVFLGLLPVSVEMYHLVCLLAKEGRNVGVCR